MIERNDEGHPPQKGTRQSFLIVFVERIVLATTTVPICDRGTSPTTTQQVATASYSEVTPPPSSLSE